MLHRKLSRTCGAVVLEIEGRTLKLPTIGDITEEVGKGSGFCPTRLRQKIDVVHPGLVVAWAGREITAIAVLKELRSWISVKGVSLQTVEDFFESDFVNDSIANLSAGFVGYCLANGKLLKFWKNADLIIPTSEFGEVVLLGTGSRDARERLWRSLDMPISTSGPIVPYQFALAHATSMTGGFLSEEITTTQSLGNLYGGGYEVATLGPDGFEKLDETLFVFWDTVPAQDGTMQYSMKLLSFYKYYGDDLLIWSYQATVETGQFVIKSSDGFVVPPVWKNASEIDFSKFPLPPSIKYNFI